MNYKQKYINLVEKLETLIKAFYAIPLEKDENVSKEIPQDIEEILNNEKADNMPSGVEIAKGEAIIYASIEDLSEAKMLLLARENLKKLLQDETINHKFHY